MYFKDTAVCDLSVEVGPCRESLPRYHFDERSGICVGFVYGGCGGNGNNFVSQEACESLCGADSTEGSTELRNIGEWKHESLVTSPT